MTSKIRVEEIVDLIDFLCICGFPEEFEIMGRLIVDKLSYVSDFSMDNGKAKEWSGAILYLIAKESGLFKMSEVRKNDEMCISEEKMAKLIIRVKYDIMKYNADKIRKALPKNFKCYVKLKNNAAYEIMSNFSTNVKSAKDITNIDDICEYFYDFPLQVLEAIEDYINQQFRKVTIQNRKDLLEEARNKIPDDVFENLHGRFLDNNETMTYLRLKFDIGILNYVGYNFKDALQPFKEVLEIDKTDMFGARHRILPCLIKLNRLEEAKQFVCEFKNDESTFMLYNKALYYHICNDEVNANLYIQKAFEKNNIVPKYILGIEDKSFEEENVTDFMGGVKSIYPEGSKEEALVYKNVIDLFWRDTQERRLWLLDEYFSYLERSNIEIEVKRDYIENNIVKYFEGYQKIKDKNLDEEEIQVKKYLDIIIKEIFEAYKEEYNHIDEYDFIKKIFDNNNENEIYVDEDLILNQNDAEITSFSQDIFNSSDDDED